MTNGRYNKNTVKLAYHFYLKGCRINKDLLSVIIKEQIRVQEKDFNDFKKLRENKEIKNDIGS